MPGWIAAVVLGACAWLALPSAVLPQPASDTAQDLLTVLGSALYPLQIMAYCQAEVTPDPAFRSAGLQWTDRNRDLVVTLETMAADSGVPAAARLAADEKALADIEALIGSERDQPAYCRFIAGVIDAGHYDLDQRKDLAPAMKRIFPTP